MSLKFFARAALAGAAIMTAQAASAVVVVPASSPTPAAFDFVSMADNSGDPNWIGNTELNWADTAFAGGLTIGGITLVASGSNANGAFADAFFDKGRAGLGVCSTVGPQSGGSGCASGIGSNTGDDNVSGAQGGETLRLAFDRTVSIAELFFRNAGHGAMNGSLKVNGGTVNIAAGMVTGGFGYLTGMSTYDFEYTGDEFYLSTVTVSPVPLPAAGLLLMGALGGLGAIGRRRRRA